MNAMDIIMAAGGIRDEDILDAEEAAGLAPAKTVPLKRKKPNMPKALYVLLPAAAGIVLIIGALGNLRMGSSGGAAPAQAFSQAAAAEASEYAAGGAISDADIKPEAAAEEAPAEAAPKAGEAAIDGAVDNGKAGTVTTEGAVSDAKMIFLDGKLYVLESTREVLECGMYDFTIEKTIPAGEEPTENLTANFETEGGVYLEDGRIAAYADGVWYVFILKE